KVHLDGYNITDALAGKAPSPRHEFFYFNDDGQLVGLRYDQWKIVFAEQKAHGAEVWREPFTTLRAPKIFNLRSDPFEVGEQEGMDWTRCWVEHIFLLGPARHTLRSSSARSGSFRLARSPAVSRSTTCSRRWRHQGKTTDGDVRCRFAPCKKEAFV